MNKQKQAFTLVELIVVIIILAILGTIAFISLQGYSKTSRDSVRISDLSTMKTGLELFHLDSGKYPNTTTGYNITYSGGIVWTQGIFGNDTKNNVDKLDKIPKDPLTEKEYTYSLTNTKQEYQLAGMMETSGIALNTLQETNAGDVVATAMVTGNYNGQTIKTQSGTDCEILSIPTIVSAEGDTQTDLVQILTNQDLVYNGYNNLPGNYKGSKYKTGEGFKFTSNKLVVYSDDKSCSPLYDSTNNTARIELIENLQTAYSGTIIESNDNIKGTLAIDTTDSNQMKLMSATFVNNNLGGSLSTRSSGPTELICPDGEHTEDGENCESDTQLCSITNGTGESTWDGDSWGSCMVSTCDTDYYNNGDNTCSPVGIGYYSTDTDTNRTACSNKSANSHYTGSGNGTNSCTYSSSVISLNYANLNTVMNGIYWRINPLDGITYYQFSNDGINWGVDKSMTSPTSIFSQGTYLTDGSGLEVLRCGTPSIIYVRGKISEGEYTSASQLTHNIPCVFLPSTMSINGKVRDNLPIGYQYMFDGVWKKKEATIAHYNHTILRYIDGSGAISWGRQGWNRDSGSDNYTKGTTAINNVLCPANKSWNGSTSSPVCTTLASNQKPDCYNKTDKGNTNPQSLWDNASNNSWVCLRSGNYAVAYYKIGSMVSGNCTTNDNVFDKTKVFYTSDGVNWLNPRNPARSARICNQNLSTDWTKWRLDLSGDETWPNAEAGTATLIRNGRVRTSGYFQNWPAPNIDRGIATFRY